jgi:transposase
MANHLEASGEIIQFFADFFTQWVAFFTTDLTISVTQIIEYYGARWKIEAGFKEIKQEIGVPAARPVPPMRSRTTSISACWPRP